MHIIMQHFHHFVYRCSSVLAVLRHHQAQCWLIVTHVYIILLISMDMDNNIRQNPYDILDVNSILSCWSCYWETSENILSYCYFNFTGHSGNSTDGHCPYPGSKCASPSHEELHQETPWRMAITRAATRGTADALVCGTGRFKRITESGERSKAFLEPWRNVTDFLFTKLYQTRARCCQIYI